MYTISTDRNLNRKRIRKLLIIGLTGSLLTGIGDFLLGYGEAAEASGLAENLMANALNMSDGQLICGSLLGVIGIFLEGLARFAIYRLMADSSPKYAHIFRAGIIGYIWLAPIGCHMNVGLMNIAYRYLLPLDASAASRLAQIMIYSFCLPLWALLIIFWLPAIIVQFRAFASGCTPYPKKARWFCLPVGILPTLILSLVIGPHTALGSGIGMMFLSLGNAFVFGGLLVTLPSQERFDEFERAVMKIER